MSCFLAIFTGQPWDSRKDKNIYEKENQGKQRDRETEKGYKGEMNGKVNVWFP